MLRPKFFSGRRPPRTGRFFEYISWIIDGSLDFVTLHARIGAAKIASSRGM